MARIRDIVIVVNNGQDIVVIGRNIFIVNWDIVIFVLKGDSSNGIIVVIIVFIVGVAIITVVVLILIIAEGESSKRFGVHTVEGGQHKTPRTGRSALIAGVRLLGLVTGVIIFFFNLFFILSGGF